MSLSHFHLLFRPFTLSLLSSAFCFLHSSSNLILLFYLFSPVVSLASSPFTPPAPSSRPYLCSFSNYLFPIMPQSFFLFPLLTYSVTLLHLPYLFPSPLPHPYCSFFVSSSVLCLCFQFLKVKSACATPPAALVITLILSPPHSPVPSSLSHSLYIPFGHFPH